MKTTIKLFAVLFALATLTFSCNQEEVTPDIKGQPASYRDFDYNEGPLSYDTEDPVKNSPDRDYSDARDANAFRGIGGKSNTPDK